MRRSMTEPGQLRQDAFMLPADFRVSPSTETIRTLAPSAPAIRVTEAVRGRVDLARALVEIA
jgi:hypothetical protein